jgi:hypothetical protein
MGDLRNYLVAAIQLEHATIPPYLCALYPIKDGTNFAATEAVGVIVREEMLHLSLATNMLNAIGGKPDLVADGFVATYPTGLQNGEDRFTVDLERFCEHAIDTFLNIEMPSRGKSGKRSAQASAALNLAISKSHILPMRPSIFDGENTTSSPAPRTSSGRIRSPSPTTARK